MRLKAMIYTLTRDDMPLLSQWIKKSKSEDLDFLVGVSGFEPEASWTRTKRDTKLRHTPLTLPLY